MVTLSLLAWGQEWTRELGYSHFCCVLFWVPLLCGWSGKRLNLQEKTEEFANLTQVICYFRSNYVLFVEGKERLEYCISWYNYG